MEANQEVHDSESVLSMENVGLPVYISEWVFVETGNILVSSPSLSIVSWLVKIINKLSEISISLFGQSTNTSTICYQA